MEELPNEIIGLIGTFLEPKDRVRFSKVNKRIYKIIQDEHRKVYDKEEVIYRYGRVLSGWVKSVEEDPDFEKRKRGRYTYERGGHVNTFIYGFEDAEGFLFLKGKWVMIVRKFKYMNGVIIYDDLTNGMEFWYEHGRLHRETDHYLNYGLCYDSSKVVDISTEDFYAEWDGERKVYMDIDENVRRTIFLK